MKKTLFAAAVLLIVAVPYVADARCATARTLLETALSLTESLERDLYRAGLHEDAHLLSAFRHSATNRLATLPLSC